MLWVDEKYLKLASNNLRNFKKVDTHKFNFSCPFCGDSQKNKNKARGYAYQSGQDLIFYCHNGCGGKSFSTLLKQISPYFLKQYLFEKFIKKESEVFNEEKTFSFDVFLEKNNCIDGTIPKCSQLINDHIAIKYLKNRKIDQSLYDIIYYCNDLNILKENFVDYKDTIFKKEPRLVIPINNQYNKFVGVVTRSIDKYSILRYINLKINDDEKLIYGLNTCDFNKQIFVCEGIFDSFFIKNSLACNTLDFSGAFQYLNKLRDVLVFDNTPRNLNLIKKMESAANNGFNVCVWPDYIKGKDVNEMIINNELSKNLVNDFINANSYNGLHLKLKIGNWRKI